ncbi:AAA family ATPase [Pseudochrobactrum asaccharolyticum]|uniref:Wobble nucleotide-excising tRNase n=1 Tax=Pseudochrobactrum asaccharolyticum TaxID=354351 RepID=A0A366DFJ9_9HYPH|nr:AAA family ATPase [Pseudochrobactrum asaccharolyticum]RBO88776.1 wobble nucleotide-excising tRNase [Pseudochrobactrum asaccharolyticum]
MFKRISIIREFGVFGNFSGGALPEFAPFNLIYGWNYSGKTTLSRMFRCLEDGELHPDYPNARFGVLRADGTQLDHNFETPCNIRVFNEDFRNAHLRWDDEDGFNPILLLGEENIARRDELKEKEARRAQLDDQRKAAAAEAGRHKDRIGKAETDCASLIVKELPGVGRFNKTSLRPIMNEWNGTLPEALSADQVQAARAKISAEQKDKLPDLSITTRPISALWQDGIALLGELIASPATISRLADHPDIATWVEHGRQLHKGRSQCEFCEGELTAARVSTLNAHFSDAFEDLKGRITTAINGLTSHRMEFSGAAYPRSGFYSDLHEEHTEAGGELALARDRFNSTIQALTDALEKKRNNPFDVVPAPEKEPQSAPLAEAARRFQTLIDKNNERTGRFTSARNEAIATLKKHYVAEAMRRIDRFALEAQIDLQQAAEATSVQALITLDAEIANLQGELSKAVKGAEAINDTLYNFFGKADIQVKVTDDDRFLLMRGHLAARNLSEGERTAVAFCYFITKLLENGNDLSQTIVYIDDPISSLDAHHLLHINAFIKNTFYRFDSAANPKHVCLAKQLFISTHNYEFFHLTWEWMANGTPKGFAAAYMIERTDGNGLVSSQVVECPESIRKYRSEYMFLYHQLAHYLDAPTNDAQVIFNLGNMARRFIEGYLAFKFFEHSKIDLTLPRIITDPVQCERARKFMHFHSHTLNRAGGMKLSDMSEAQSIVMLILDAVRDHDPVHYGALEATR